MPGVPVEARGQQAAVTGVTKRVQELNVGNRLVTVALPAEPFCCSGLLIVLGSRVFFWPSLT